MMDVEEEHAFPVGEAQERGPQHQVRAEVEGLEGVLLDRLGDRSLTRAGASAC